MDDRGRSEDGVRTFDANRGDPYWDGVSTGRRDQHHERENVRGR